MRYKTLLTVKKDIGPWQYKIVKAFSEKCEQAVVTSYNALQDVTEGYSGNRTLVTNYKVV